ncbi:MAG: hypothetical protein RLZZ441_1050 [Actinomycetota bacterium]
MGVGRTFRSGASGRRRLDFREDLGVGVADRSASRPQLGRGRGLPPVLLKIPNPNRAGDFVVGEGFEPPKAEPAELQSDPFGRLGNPPGAFHTEVIHDEARN